MEGRSERKGNGKEILSEHGKILVLALILLVVQRRDINTPSVLQETVEK